MGVLALRRAGWLSVMGMLAPLLCGCGGDSDADTPARSGTIPIGALLSLTGNGTSLGTASRAVLEIAAQDADADRARQGSSARVRLIVEDTGQDPAAALGRLQDLAGQGVRIVIGPQSSAELAAVKPFADENGILVISHGSTAGALAIPGDNIFRIVPDDAREVQALITLMQQDGIRAVVPLQRDDLGNQGLVTAMRAQFPATGGVVSEGAVYGTQTTDFTSSLATVHAQVSALSGAGPVAVYLAGFDEAAVVLSQAGTDPVLSSVRWYTGDGVALIKPILADPNAAAFAARVNLISVTLGLPDAQKPRWQPIADAVRARTGIQPDVFALAAYDALRLAVTADLNAGGTGNITALKNAFVQAADNTVGIIGPTTLNAAGDRASEDFGFWAVRATATGFDWLRVARFIVGPGGTGSIVRLE